MENPFGDPNLSSSQLRLKACTIIAESDRPLASCEVENWIRQHDFELWSKVSSKCKDYVRVILSQTRGQKITKYKCTKSLPGIDKRSTFYGTYGRKYDEDTWIPVSDTKDKKIKIEQTPQRPKRTAPITAKIQTNPTIVTSLRENLTPKEQDQVETKIPQIAPIQMIYPQQPLIQPIPDRDELFLRQIGPLYLVTTF